jgi:hypothetical protein
VGCFLLPSSQISWFRALHPRVNRRRNSADDGDKD